MLLWGWWFFGVWGCDVVVVVVVVVDVGVVAVVGIAVVVGVVGSMQAAPPQPLSSAFWGPRSGERRNSLKNHARSCHTNHKYPADPEINVAWSTFEDESARALVTDD